MCFLNQHNLSIETVRLTCASWNGVTTIQIFYTNSKVLKESHHKKPKPTEDNCK